MLSCFPCGRSSSAMEPSPPHRFSLTKYGNDVNGPLIRNNLEVTSSGANAKKGDPRNSPSKCARRSDASDCQTIQKEVVMSTIVMKGKDTGEHKKRTTKDVKLVKCLTENAEVLGLDEEICNEVDIKSTMQDGFSKHTAVDGANGLLSCHPQTAEDNTILHNTVISSKLICKDTLADAGSEIAIAEEEDTAPKKGLNAKESKSQPYEAHSKMEKYAIASKRIDDGYLAKKGLKARKHKESTRLFSYGISDQQRDFLFLCAGLVIQAVGFQLKSIVEVVTTIILLGYRAYFFASRIADSLSHIKERLRETHTKLLRIVVSKEQRKSLALHIEKLETMKPLLIAEAKRMGWGCVTAAYILALLTALLFISLVFSYFAVKGSSTQKLIHITKELHFDYTKSHPVASLDLLSLNTYHKCNASKTSKANQLTSLRYRCTMFLTIPESRFNRNLGVFQVMTELLSETDEVLMRGSRPCMLEFKSNTLHYVKSICLAIPLLVGATSETQTLSLTLLEWQQDAVLCKHPSMLRISLVPRAGRASRNGLPELYKAEIHVNSDWVPSSASGSSIRTVVMWIGLSCLLFGTFSSFCMYKIRHNRSSS